MYYIYIQFLAKLLGGIPPSYLPQNSSPLPFLIQHIPPTHAIELSIYCSFKFTLPTFTHHTYLPPPLLISHTNKNSHHAIPSFSNN